MSDYVSFEVAKLLKEKGYKQSFDESHYEYGDDGNSYWYSCIGAYDIVDNVTNRYERPRITYPCPTLWETQKWLRRERNIHIVIYHSSDWNHTICNISENEWLSEGYDFDTYEEALNEGIKEALNLL